jgi:hypothetical protein
MGCRPFRKGIPHENQQNGYFGHAPRDATSVPGGYVSGFKEATSRRRAVTPQQGDLARTSSPRRARFRFASLAGSASHV